jgi:hypothetical protein
METKYITITLGYEMSRNECERLLSEEGLSWNDFSSEDEAFREMAEKKFNFGLGCNAEIK